MDEWAAEFGSPAPESLRVALRQVMDQQMARAMTDNQRAAAAWYRANGDRERAHTVGVFLKRSRVPAAPPILGVFVDSHAMATDFGVNREIYLARLANVGFAVSGIEFSVSRDARAHRAARAAATRPAEPAALPDLSSAERREVEELVSELPESLRDVASKAVEISKRREKQKSANNGTTG